MVKDQEIGVELSWFKIQPCPYSQSFCSFIGKMGIKLITSQNCSEWDKCDHSQLVLSRAWPHTEHSLIYANNDEDISKFYKFRLAGVGK